MEYDGYKDANRLHILEYACLKYALRTEKEVENAEIFMQKDYPIGVRVSSKAVLILYNPNRSNEVACLGNLREAIGRNKDGLISVANESKG